MNANFTQNLIMSTLTIEHVFSQGKWIYKQQTGFHVSFMSQNETFARAGLWGAK